MRYAVLDIETDGLIDEVTKIHCLSYAIYIDNVLIERGSLRSYNEIINFILLQGILVGHNIIRYDIPVLEKILGIKITARLIDTLALSWYLYPSRIKHGLEGFGEEFGVLKPVINDWTNLSVEEYIHRCNRDVEINSKLFINQMHYMMRIYVGDTAKVNQLIDYLSFKLDCAKEQEEVGCRIDLELINTSLEELYILQNEKTLALIEAMPKSITYKEYRKPSKMYKKDLSLSSAGYKWLTLLEENNLSENFDDVLTLPILEEDGNPSSTQQLKSWLESLGWVPETFVFTKDKEGNPKSVPQIYVSDEVCDSIKRLYTVEPALENLDMLSLIKHRIGIFKGLLEAQYKPGWVRAEIAGLTNTLRFKHKKPIVNLPKVFKFYGEQIRGSIVAPSDSYVLCGSDMSSLEDSTKQHYMYFYDPEYVTQMRTPGFDPHLDIGILAGMLTVEQADRHKAKEQDFSQIRNLAKVVNFSAVYGCGPPKIAQSTGMSLQEAQALHRTYWNRNKSVKFIARDAVTKTVDGQMWQFNPVSGFWYTLRFEKDKFSTLNQGTGVFCFDLWVRQLRNRGIKIMIQYHDEVVIPLEKGREEEIKQTIQEAITAVNDAVKLNVPLGVSVDLGINYAQIH